MTSEIEMGLLDEKYILKRLVYVNSANHGFSEIMLDSHMAMFGGNNVGKTASLAGTKLLLLSETNFNNCEKKFKFEGKRGIYSKEESYDFYFPDARTFIILEVENPEGKFCMALYKTTNYSYGRFFIPVAFEQLRHLFWNIETEEFAENIGVKALSKFAKVHKGIQVTDRNEIAHLMYSSFRDSPAKKRFCVLPLKDNRKESIDAFRSIYQLSFETGNTETDALPMAIATLLEMGRSRDQERLDANLTLLADEHSKLVLKKVWLQKLLNAQPVFNRAKSLLDDSNNKLLDYSVFYHSLYQTVTTQKAQFAPKKQESDTLYHQKLSMKEMASNYIRKLQKQNDNEAGALNEKEKTLQIKQKLLIKSKSLKAMYPDKSVAEIMTWFECDLKESKENLCEHKKEGGIQRQLERNIKARNFIIKDIEALKKLLSNNGSILLHQLSEYNEETANILHSLNPGLEKINSKLSVPQTEIILRFTELFGVDRSGCLTFLQQTIGDIKYSEFDAVNTKVRLEAELYKKQEKYNDLNIEIAEQNNAISKKNLEELITKIEKDIVSLNKDIADISGLNSLEKEVNNLKEELTVRQNTFESEESRLGKLKQEYTTLKGECNSLHSKVEGLNKQQEHFNTIDNVLNDTKRTVPPLFVNTDELQEVSLSKDSADMLQRKAYDFKDKFGAFRSEVNGLQNTLPHPDIDNHREMGDLASYKTVIQAYEQDYTTLEYENLQLRDAIRSHNQLVNNQLNELKEAKELLHSFVKEINDELNNKNISNLSEIKLNLILNGSFLSLLDTLDKHDIQDDSLLEAGFYESLAVFVEKYFNKKSRYLKIHDIISAVTYQYKLEGNPDVVTKSQSGGTTIAITAFVLTVLLKRITPKYVLLQMPIIVDEIGTLDLKNTSSTIDQIAEHGFSIFCATPSFSAFVSQKVGRWIMIDQSMVKVPMVSGCHMNIMPDHIESFGEYKR